MDVQIGWKDGLMLEMLGGESLALGLEVVVREGVKLDD